MTEFKEEQFTTEYIDKLVSERKDKLTKEGRSICEVYNCSSYSSNGCKKGTPLICPVTLIKGVSRNEHLIYIDLQKHSINTSILSYITIQLLNNTEKERQKQRLKEREKEKTTGLLEKLENKGGEKVAVLEVENKSTLFINFVKEPKDEVIEYLFRELYREDFILTNNTTVRVSRKYNKELNKHRWVLTVPVVFNIFDIQDLVKQLLELKEYKVECD